MANPEHIKWLLEGVEAWNERRRSNFFLPDFGGYLPREVDLKGVNLNGADLSNVSLVESSLIDSDISFANLTNAYLAGINLTSANLTNTDLTGANLTSANLTSANLTNTDLSGANLTSANLTSANLTNTDLSDTNLADANLTNANLLFANLADATLAGAQPWKAMLFLGQSSKDMENPGPITEGSTIDSVGNLLEKIKDTKKETTTLYFRGESECRWNLKPSVKRKDGLNESEGEMLRQLITRRPQEFKGMSSALEEWVLAQHHGLPTRFLDITRNPLVALFNACNRESGKNGLLHIFAVPRDLIKPFSSDSVSVIANFAKLMQFEQQSLLGLKEWLPAFPAVHSRAKIRLYQGIRQEKPYFEERIDIRDLYKVFVVEPQLSSERIRAQSGAFLVSAFHDRFEPEEILRWNEGIPIYSHYKLIVPSACKEYIMGELELLNITEETLSPGLDSSADTVKDIYSRNQSEANASNDCGAC